MSIRVLSTVEKNNQRVRISIPIKVALAHQGSDPGRLRDEWRRGTAVHGFGGPEPRGAEATSRDNVSQMWGQSLREGGEAAGHQFADAGGGAQGKGVKSRDNGSRMCGGGLQKKGCDIAGQRFTPVSPSA